MTDTLRTISAHLALLMAVLIGGGAIAAGFIIAGEHRFLNGRQK